MFSASFFISHFFQHPFIAQPVSAIYNGVGVAIMRKFYPKGSLRDAIYGVRNALSCFDAFSSCWEYSVVHKDTC